MWVGVCGVWSTYDRQGNNSRVVWWESRGICLFNTVSIKIIVIWCFWRPFWRLTHSTDFNQHCAQLWGQGEMERTVWSHASIVRAWPHTHLIRWLVPNVDMNSRCQQAMGWQMHWVAVIHTFQATWHGPLVRMNPPNSCCQVQPNDLNLGLPIAASSGIDHTRARTLYPTQGYRLT